MFIKLGALSLVVGACPAFCMASLLMSDEEVQNESVQESATQEIEGPCCVKPVQECMVIIPDCCRVKIFDPQGLECDKHFWLEGDLLYWQANEDGLSFAMESDSTTSIKNGQIIHPDFDWDWGFRLGLGYKIPHDKWDLFFNYTYIQSKADGSADATAVFPTMESSFGLPSGYYATKANFNWKSTVNVADLELGRNCFVSRWLSIRPFMGVRGALIDQTTTVWYQGGTAVPLGDTDKCHLTNDFWGVGLRMGFDSLWGLGAGWGIYGNGAASVLSGKFSVKQMEKWVNADEKRVSLTADKDSIVVAAEMALGVQWDYMFSRDRYHFGMKFGWEFNVFFDQNQMVRVTNSSFNPNDGDLAFQGVTLGFRFDF